jgi:tight adherence protein C
MELLLTESQRSFANTETALLGVIFLTVVLLVMGCVGLLAGQDPIRRRLESSVAKPKTGRPGTSLRYGNLRFPLAGLFRRLQTKAAPKDEDRLSLVRRRLVQAGYLNPGAVGTYYAARLVLAVGLPPVTGLLLPLLVGNLSPDKVILVVLGSAVGGFYLPYLWVAQKVQKRQQAAREGFPDALDMLLVCVEAGLSLAAALNRVGAEFASARPVLGEQFKLVALEMQAGTSRELALRNLAERIGIEEVRSLVTLLLQSEALGTSIAQSLRVHADDMRKRRLLRAEERANKLPAKMALPLILFILTSLMTVIMTPIIIRVVRVLLPTLGGS